MTGTPGIFHCGARIVRDPITGAEEERILLRISQAPWMTELSRRVQHYGYRYDYRARGAGRHDPAAPFPRWAEAVAGRLAPHFAGRVPERCIVNEYRPGQGIGMHADHAAFGPVVASLPLGAAGAMRFRPRSARPCARGGCPPTRSRFCPAAPCPSSPAPPGPTGCTVSTATPTRGAAPCGYRRPSARLRPDPPPCPAQGAACTANAMHATATGKRTTTETGPLARVPLPAVSRHARARALAGRGNREEQQQLRASLTLRASRRRRLALAAHRTRRHPPENTRRRSRGLRPRAGSGPGLGAFGAFACAPCRSLAGPDRTRRRRNRRAGIRPVRGCPSPKARALGSSGSLEGAIGTRLERAPGRSQPSSSTRRSGDTSWLSVSTARK